MTQLSRREFAALAAGATVSPLALGSSPAFAASMTAQDVIDRIKSQVGVAWQPETVDGLKVGDPATVVTGIVTTAMASLAVLQQAVEAGANVIVSSQPTFYTKADARTPPVARPGRRISRRTAARDTALPNSGGAAGCRVRGEKRLC